MADRYTKKVIAIADDYIKYGGRMEKFGNKIVTASPNMFTFIRHPELPPTNNHTEQSIRRPVIWRKVHGQLRNESGMRRLGITMTCFMTWKLRGLNPLDELAKVI